MSFKKYFLSLCLTFFIFPSNILAQPNTTEQSPLQGTMKIYKIVKIGEKYYQYDATNAKPGDILEYTITYKNVSQKTLKDIQITGPIPANTYFLKNRFKLEKSKELLASIDGGEQFAKPPLKKQIKRDGKLFWVEVSEKEWTHICCLVSQLVPNEIATMKYWVMVK